MTLVRRLAVYDAVLTLGTASVSIEAWRQNRGLCRYLEALMINEQTIPPQELDFVHHFLARSPFSKLQWL